jgi:hypothetical protein
VAGAIGSSAMPSGSNRVYRPPTASCWDAMIVVAGLFTVSVLATTIQ